MKINWLYSLLNHNFVSCSLPSVSDFVSHFSLFLYVLPESNELSLTKLLINTTVYSTPLLHFYLFRLCSVVTWTLTLTHVFPLWLVHLSHGSCFKCYCCCLSLSRPLCSVLKWLKFLPMDLLSRFTQLSPCYYCLESLFSVTVGILNLFGQMTIKAYCSKGNILSDVCKPFS